MNFDLRSSAEISGRSLSPQQREAVVAEAKAWVAAHTPYVPHGKVKGAGCDCATFIFCVYRDLGFAPEVELGNYSIQAHLHQPMNAEHRRQLTQYLETIASFSDEITEAEAQPGDVVIFKAGLAFAHGAIIVEKSESGFMVAHAQVGIGVVLADVHRDPHLNRRERKFFRRNFLKG